MRNNLLVKAKELIRVDRTIKKCVARKIDWAAVSCFMTICKKQWTQKIPGRVDEVWSFFSRPENLNEITPSDMKFEIITDVANAEMYPGITIDYKVSPFPFLKLPWKTEITEIEERKYFIDEQLKGPFKLWRHKHSFEQKDDHVVMNDILEYEVPFGVLGTLANRLLVDARIEQIFDYRYKRIEEMFGVVREKVTA